MQYSHHTKEKGKAQWTEIMQLANIFLSHSTDTLFLSLFLITNLLI